MKRPSKEEYESMTDVQRNRWFLQFQQMHQTMWGFNPHGGRILQFRNAAGNRYTGC